MAYMNYEKLMADDEETQDNIENSNFASRAIARGTDQLQGMAWGGLGILGDKLGSDTLKTVGIKGYLRNQEEAAKNPGMAMDDIHGVLDFGQWATEKLIENIPNMASTLGVGGLLGMGIKTAAKNAVAKGVTAAMGSYLSGGGVYGEGIERGIDNSTSAAVSGLLMGALDVAGGTSRIFHFSDATKGAIEAATTAGKKAVMEGKLGVAKAFLRKASGYVKSEGTIQAIGESFQNMGQEMISLLNIWHNEDGFDLWSDNNLKRVFEAGLAGASVGGITGVLTSKAFPEDGGGLNKRLKDVNLGEEGKSSPDITDEEAMFEHREGIAQRKDKYILDEEVDRYITQEKREKIQERNEKAGLEAQEILDVEKNKGNEVKLSENKGNEIKLLEDKSNEARFLEPSTGIKKKLDEIEAHKKQLEEKFPNAPEDRLYYLAAKKLGYLEEYNEYKEVTEAKKEYEQIKSKREEDEIWDALEKEEKEKEFKKREEDKELDRMTKEEEEKRYAKKKKEDEDFNELLEAEKAKKRNDAKEWGKLVKEEEIKKREEEKNKNIGLGITQQGRDNIYDGFVESQRIKQEIKKNEANAKELISTPAIKKENSIVEKKAGDKIKIVKDDGTSKIERVERTFDVDYVPQSYGEEFKSPDTQALFKKYVSDKNIKVTDDNIKDTVTAFKDVNKNEIENISKRKSRVFIEDDDKPTSIQYEVVELEDLISSEDRSGLYPDGLQPRNRDQKVLKLKLEQIANKFVPERTFESSTPSNGAPIVSKDSITLEGDGNISKKNIVLSGNGLTEVFKLLHDKHPEKVKGYTELLKTEAAKYGISPETIDGMKQPVFIRRIIDDIDERKFAIRANDKTAAEYTPVETANIDSKLIDNAELGELDGTESGFKRFTTKLISKMPSSDQTGQITKGDRLNQKAIERAKTALFKKAYGDDSLLSKKFEATDDNMKRITSGLDSASETFAKLDHNDKATKSKQISKAIVDAVQIVEDAKNGYKDINAKPGMSKLETQVEAQTKQTRLDGEYSKESVAIAKVLAKNANSGRKVGAFIEHIGRQYLTEVNGLDQMEMFKSGNKKLSILGMIKESESKLQETSKKSIVQNAVIKDSITFDDINKAFKNQTVTPRDNGYEVHFKDGHSWLVDTVNEITDDSIVLSGKAKIAGKFDPESRRIEISKYGDYWTLRHEQYHAFETLGMINKSEINIINREISGKNTTEEQRALWVEDNLKKRDYNRKSIVGRVIQKIADFVDGIVNIGMTTSRGVLRNIESGKISERLQAPSTDNGTRFSVKEIEESGYFEAPKKKKTFEDIKNIVKESLDNKEAIKDNFKIKTAEAADKFKINFVDRLHAISVYLGENSRAYKKERLFTGIRETVDAFLKHGEMKIRDGMITVNTKDKGFMSLYNKYGEDNLRKATYWMAVDRAAALERNGREKWLTPDARKFIMEAIGKPPEGQSWQKIATEVQKFNDNVVAIAEHAGIIKKGEKDGWIGDFFVPFHRIFEDPETGAEFFRGKQLSRKHISAQIKRLSGAEMKLGDPISNMIKNWSHLIHESSRNMARMDTVDSLNSKNIQVGEYRNGKPKMLLEKVNSAGQFRYNKETKQTYVIGDNDANPVISMRREGKAEYYKINDEYLYTALAQTDIVNKNSLLWKAATMSKRLFTQSVMANPATLAANIHRDIMNAKIMLKDFTLGDAFRGAKSAWTQDENYILMQSAQATFGRNYVDADDSRNFQKYVDKITKRKKFDGVTGTVLDGGAKILSFFKKIQDVSENAVRAGIFEKQLNKKGGNVLDAAFSAKDIIDFSNSGQDKILNTLTAVTPFMGSRIQGLYSGIRHYKQDRLGVALRGSVLAAATAALWAINKDDDKYKQLEDWDKRTYYHMFMGDYHIRVPKPFEVGAVFSSLIDSTLDSLAGDENGKYFKDAIVSMVFDTFNLMPSSPLPKTALEIAANKNFFTQRPIESLALQSLKPGARAEWYTSDTAQVLGKKLNMSPRKLEHLVRGQFAWLGMTVLSFVDVVSRNLYDLPKHPTDRIDDTMLIGRFVNESDKPARQNKYMTNFYKAWKDISQSHNTIKMYTLSGDLESARKISTDDKEYAKWYKEFNSVKSKVSAISKQMKNISRSRSITPELKDKQIDRLLLERNKLYKQTMERYRKG